MIAYLHPAVRLVNGSTITAASYLHRDALGSVRAITDAAGVKVESAVYRPFGEQTEWLSPAAPAPEAKGWIGERYDASAGLQYLNARYYDPELGMFLQPDWFEVTLPGVGRNRYSYSFNDPVNGRDPGGNEFEPSTEPKQGSWWERMFLGTASHGLFSGRAQAAGYEDTLTNRTMNTAVAFFNSPGSFIASAMMDREAASQALSRADLLIRRDDVVHVFELKGSGSV